MSHTTAHKILVEKGFSYGTQHLVQNLTPDEKISRVNFCKEMLHEDQMIFETFFSDEMGINLSDAHQTKAWGKDHQTMEIEIPRDNVHLSC